MPKVIIESVNIIDGREIPHTHCINGIEGAEVNRATGNIEIRANGKLYKEYDPKKKHSIGEIKSWRVEAD